jgi:hypothetical protein
MCNKEVLGLYRMALYINKDVKYNYPDPSKKSEVDLIAHGTGSYVIENYDNPKWERTVNYSQNYKQNYLDKFIFELKGVENEIPAIIKDLRNNRLGYIAEIITLNNNSYVFPQPVFLSIENTKQVNQNNWIVELSYRVETFKDYFKKLNTVLMVASYLSIGNNAFLSNKNNNVITTN